MPLAHNIAKEVGLHLSSPSRPSTGSALPSPYIKNKLPAPSRGANKQASNEGTCCLFSLPAAAAGAPRKLCLNSSSGLLSISID